jgi:hypothetical protein
MENEKSVLRWGGLAGILAVIVFIVGMPLYALVDPFTPEGLMTFPDARTAIALSISLSMATAFLSIAFVLVLYRTLQRTSQTIALIGSVLGVIGYIVTALGDASTIVAFAPLSDLYHASGATPETQATVVLLWQTTMGITSTFFFVGGLFMMIGFIALGVAMLGATAFGRRFGRVSIVLGVIGLVGVVASLFVPGLIGMQLMGSTAFVNLIFLPLFGWKVYRLSRAAKITEMNTSEE